MKKGKGKYKGVRYIANSLKRYYKKDYPSYKDALPKARELFTELQKSNKEIKLANIFPLLKKPKKAKGQAPELDKNLKKRKWYFELEDYPVYIARCPNTIWFTSKLIPKGLPDIQGGSTPSYYVYFAPYVDFINKMANLADKEDKRYETEWLVTCTEPEYNRSKKRWESEIISINNRDEKIDYGFNPNKPKQGPEDLILSQEKPEEPKKVPEKEKVEEETKAPSEIPEKEEKPSAKKEDIEKIKEERLLKEQEEKTIKAKVQAVKELKELGFTMEEIKKYLGI